MKVISIIICLFISLVAIGQTAEELPPDEKNHREQYYKALRNADHVTRLFIDRDAFNQIPKTIVHFKKLEKLECHANTSLTEDDILILKSLPNLKDLDIHGELYELPKNLEILSNLNHLRLHTRMAKAPDCLCNMPQLRKIDLVGDIQTLPSCFAKMEALRSLNFYFNDFATFPEVICKIPNLDSLTFSAKALQTVPIAFKTMDIKYLKVSGLINNYVASQVLQLSHLKHLDINQCKLTELPNDMRIQGVEEIVFSGSERLYYEDVFQLFSEFKNLKALSISGAHLNILGPEISKLTSLEKLTITHSSIKKISPEFYSLKNLKYLKLTEINTLPGSEISNLSNLEYLELADGLGSYSMEPVMALKKLKYLSLTDLGITQVPDKIGDLTELTELNIGDNKINALPSKIGQLKNLVVLKAGHNVLDKLPSEIGELKNLTYLSVPSTSISSLPKSFYNLKNIKTIIGSKNFSSSTTEKIKKTFGAESLRFDSAPSPKL